MTAAEPVRFFWSPDDADTDTVDVRLARRQIEHALESEGDVSLLVFPVDSSPPAGWDEDLLDGPAVALEPTREELAEILRDAPGDELTLALSAGDLYRAFGAPDVEAHGLGARTFVATAVAAASIGGSSAAAAPIVPGPGGPTAVEVAGPDAAPQTRVPGGDPGTATTEVPGGGTGVAVPTPGDPGGPAQTQDVPGAGAGVAAPTPGNPGGPAQTRLPGGGPGVAMPTPGDPGGPARVRVPPPETGAAAKSIRRYRLVGTGTRKGRR